MLTDDDRARILALARRMLEAHVRREPQPAAEGGGALDLPRGAFVSLHRRSGELRGCLGRLETTGALGEVVAHLARAVADSDPRFDPVEPHELADLDVEVSVLTPEQEIASPDEIEVGRHGLIVEHGHRRGLLLPQVATQYGWDRITFLEHTCVKAGLPRDAWRLGARILVFEAEVFGEHSGR